MVNTRMGNHACIISPQLYLQKHMGVLVFVIWVIIFFIIFVRYCCLTSSLLLGNAESFSRSAWNWNSPICSIIVWYQYCRFFLWFVAKISHICLSILYLFQNILNLIWMLYFTMVITIYTRRSPRFNRLAIAGFEYTNKLFFMTFYMALWLPQCPHIGC